MLLTLIKKDVERSRMLAGHEPRLASRSSYLLVAIGPRLLPVTLCRIGIWLKRARLPLLARTVSAINVAVFGLEVGLDTDIGPGLCLPHTVGTVIGARRLGENVTVYQGVTLGAKTMDLGFTPELRPAIGDRVTIGSGAKILGGVTIGDDVVIGANAVVTRSVQAGSVVMGVPGRVVRRQRARDLNGEVRP